jgi:hypothetical protein
MSPGMTGADVVELRRLASQFDASAGMLTRLSATVSSGIKISAWVGPFALRFRHTWDSEHSVKLRAAAGLLTDQASVLRQQADEQERASSSAGGIATTVGSHVVVDGGLEGLTAAEVIARIKALEKLVREGVIDPVSLGVQFTDLVKDLSKVTNLSEITSLKDLANGINKLHLGADFHGVGGALGLLGIGLSSKDLVEGLMSGDEPAAWRGGVDAIAGIGTSFVPGGGIAWWAGTKIGEGLYNGVQTFYDTPGGAVNSALRDMYGSNVDANNLTPHQAEELVARYDGPMGIVNSTGDAIKGTLHDWSGAVGGWFH